MIYKEQNSYLLSAYILSNLPVLQCFNDCIDDMKNTNSFKTSALIKTKSVIYHLHTIIYDIQHLDID